MNVGTQLHIEGLARHLAFSRQQTLKLTAVTLTKAAYLVQQGIQEEMRRTFRDPTQFVLRSVYVRQAKVQGDAVRPAEIGIRGATSGRVSPAHALYAEVSGGDRRRKASESQLHRVMPQGMTQWVPGAGAPLNASHDIPGAYMQRVLSAMQAQSDATANSRIRGSTGISSRDLFRGQRLGVTMRNGRVLQGLRGYDSRFQQQMLRRQERTTQGRMANFFMGMARGQSSGPARILYEFKWQQKAGKRTPNRPNPQPILVKTDIKPVLIFTGPQHYRVRLPILNIAERLASQNIRRIADEEASRLFIRWNQG